MTNLAPPPARPEAAALLDELRSLRAGRAPLPGLDPGSYARDHRAFEARSDQRDLIATHLADRLARLGERTDNGPLSILSVGCGDGTLDGRLAAGLLDAAPDRAVRYVGVEPWAASAASWRETMTGLGPELSAEVHVSSFAEASITETFDVVVFVHSIYYVADVAQTLLAARARVRPGGELWVLTAPRAELNALVDVLAPPLEGHRQWFSSDVADAFAEAGIGPVDTLVLEALVDLAGAGEDSLDFAVQAVLTPELRGPVRAYLDAVSVDAPDGRRLVPHPVVVAQV